jgi:hypothetical protein
MRQTQRAHATFEQECCLEQQPVIACHLLPAKINMPDGTRIPGLQSALRTNQNT